MQDHMLYFQLQKDGENLKAIQDFWSSNTVQAGNNNFLHSSQAGHIDPPPEPILQIGYTLACLLFFRLKVGHALDSDTLHT